MIFQVLNAIAFSKESGRTNTAGAIAEARQNMFTSNNGDRSGDPNYMIVLTDGFSNVNEQNTLQEAQDAKNNGITIMAVGMGTDIKQAEIEDMASDPSNLYSFYAKRNEDIATVAAQILDELCT